MFSFFVFVFLIKTVYVIEKSRRAENFEAIVIAQASSYMSPPLQ